jgi:hypothetical protein
LSNTKQVMETNSTTEETAEISTDNIIASIRDVRNQQIDELTKDSVLMAFLEHYYDTLVISKVKKEFLLKDLKELKDTSLDLAHYSSLITQKTGLKTLSIDGSNKLFFLELERLFSKYVSRK